jgi:hypothetical protein
MMLDRPAFFLLLFPISAAFWWFFEYLNRFVQNWFYIGPQFNAWEYFWYATLPFSTVLPAVLGLRDWLLSARWLQQRFDHLKPLRIPFPKTFATLTLTLSACGLAAIGIWPNILFPLLWVAPLLIIWKLDRGSSGCNGGGHLRRVLGNVEFFQPGQMAIQHTLRTTLSHF